MVDDITIRCIQCGDEFVFTASEQRRYRTRNFSIPRRCMECRRKKAKLGDNGDHTSKNRRRKGEALSF